DPFDELAMPEGGRRIDRRAVRERSVHGVSSARREEFGARLRRRHGGSGESGRIGWWGRRRGRGAQALLARGGPCRVCSLKWGECSGRAKRLLAACRLHPPQ